MRWQRGAKVALGIAISCALGVEAGWAIYAAVRWWRYPPEAGRPRHPFGPLDAFMPATEIDERVELAIDAPAERVMAAARALELQRIPLVRALFAGRAALLRSRAEPIPPGPFLDYLPTIGWRLLAQGPHYVIFGAVTRPWERTAVFRPIAASAFATFDEPDLVKIAWTIRVEPRGERAALCITETRVTTTGPLARRRFRRYWAVFSPGILLIRRLALQAIKTAAERG